MFRFLSCLAVLTMASVAFGDTIAYTTTAQDAIYLIDPTSGSTTTVPGTLPRVVETCLSRDGQWLTFYGEGISIVRPDGSGMRQVTPTGTVCPAFSPDGSRIAFQPVYGDLFTINRDGTGQHQYVGVYGSTPEWSSDGNKILVSSWAQDGNYNCDISLYNLLSGQTTNLTAPYHLEGEAFSRMSWSPSGNHIAFERMGPDEDWDIWRADLDESDPANPRLVNLVNLTADWSAFEDGDPSWSPDGNQIAFRSNSSGNYDIWTMNADGGNKVNLTNTLGINEGGPSWGGPAGGVVPEPLSMAFMASVFVGMVGYRLRRRSRGKGQG